MRPSTFGDDAHRQIRVFISSTFRDMHAERDILIKRIFPELRKLCEQRAVGWTDVDLRWGITTEEAAEGKVLPLCLAEIDRCRPYFIGLLGDRYGWVPQSIPVELLDSEDWLKQHFQRSVTELEIIHGVLRNPEMAGRALFYFRDPAYVDTLTGDTTEFRCEDDASREKLENLKDRIRKAHAAGRLHHQPRENYRTPEALGEWILKDLTAIIDRVYPKALRPNPLDEEAARHEAYSRTRRFAFVGRTDELQRIHEHIGANGGKPLVITGESGCGKSALLANCVAIWRRKHPDDLVLQHYIGSTPESAGWQAIVQRVLGELKRAFGIGDEVPARSDTLRNALAEWMAKVPGTRRVVVVLDALNQLSSDQVARQLGWLPSNFPDNIRLLVSSLPGESLDALRKRGWPELNVPLFSRTDIGSAAIEYVGRFGKTLPSNILASIEATAVAANPLFLRAMLDELRQIGRPEDLTAAAIQYLASPDLAALFDEILARWDGDFGREPEHPDLVRRSLCLMACARLGLSESELLDLLGGSQEDPLPQRYWTPLFLAADAALAQRMGLLTFGHEHLRAAVHRRWLDGPSAEAPFRLQLADYFGRASDPTDRLLDELPIQLRATEQWERLKSVLAEPRTFSRLRSSDRWRWELQAHWSVLERAYDPVAVYRHALAAAEPQLTSKKLILLLAQLGGFHDDAARYSAAEPLHRRAMEISHRVNGATDSATLLRASSLALSLYHQGDYASAEQLFRHLLELSERSLGPEHPDTLLCVNNLGLVLKSAGDYAGAKPLYRRSFQVRERVRGFDHPETLASAHNYAALLVSAGDHVGAERLAARLVDAKERVLGLTHPSTLSTVNLLASIAHTKGDLAVQESLLRRVIEGLSPEHPTTAIALANLAAARQSGNDYDGAESLGDRAVHLAQKVLGPEHPTTIACLSRLASIVLDKGDFTRADSLTEHALGASKRVLGLRHPITLSCMRLRALALKGAGDVRGCEQLLEGAFETAMRQFGSQDPVTLAIADQLSLVLIENGDETRVEQIQRIVIEARERMLGFDHPIVLSGLRTLGLLLTKRRDFEGAETYYRRALLAAVSASKASGQNHPDMLDMVEKYVQCLLSMGASLKEATERTEAIVGVPLEINARTSQVPQ